MIKSLNKQLVKFVNKTIVFLLFSENKANLTHYQFSITVY